MVWTKNITKTPYLVLFIILISIGITSASALTITLGGTVDIIEILNMMGNRIINVGEPTASTDAATKSYVDSSSFGTPGTIDADTLDGIDSPDFVTETEHGGIPDADTLAGLSCSPNEIPKFVGSTWVCAADVDTNTDILAGLSCATNQTPRWDGGNWICGTISAVNLNLATLDSTDSVGQYTSIAIGTDGFPVISYHDLTNTALELVHCTSTICTTSDTPVTLDFVGTPSEFSSIAIGSDGFPVISHRTFSGELRLVHCKNVSCIGGVGVGFDTPLSLVGASVGLNPSIAIGIDGFPVLAYADSSDIFNREFRLIHCKIVSCIGGEGVGFDTPVTLDITGTSEVDYTSIAIGSDTFPVISYRDNGLMLVHCKNVSCIGGVGVGFDTPVTLDSSGGESTSIDIGSDGFPVISYHAPSSTLKLVHCTNESCTTNETPVTLDTGLTGGVSGTSIAIGPDNFPVISYFDSGSNDDLKLVHCKIVSCIGGVGVGFDTPVTLDSAGDVGRFSSIAIGSNNLALISYFDATPNNDLKFAVCTLQQGDCTEAVIVFE